MKCILCGGEIHSAVVERACREAGETDIHIFCSGGWERVCSTPGQAEDVTGGWPASLRSTSTGIEQDWDCRRCGYPLREGKHGVEDCPAAPRCEVPGCKARGTRKSLGALICKRHFTRAQNKVRSMGIVGFCAAQSLTKEALLSLAK